MKCWEIIANILELEMDRDEVESVFKEMYNDAKLDLNENYISRSYNGVECYDYKKMTMLTSNNINKYLASTDIFGHILISNDLISKLAKAIPYDGKICFSLILYHEAGHNLYKYGKMNPDVNIILDMEVRHIEAFSSGSAKEIVADKYSILYSNATKEDYIALRKGLYDVSKRLGGSPSDKYKYNYEVLYDTKDNPLDYQTVLNKS